MTTSLSIETISDLFKLVKEVAIACHKVTTTDRDLLSRFLLLLSDLDALRSQCMKQSLSFE